MRIIGAFRIALRSLERAPVRSSLTALGVIVGVAAVVATTSIGSGAQKKIEETLTKPESRVIHLTAMPPRSQMRRPGAKLAQKDSLHSEDYYAIRNGLSGISAASPRIFKRGIRAQGNGRAADVLLEGVDVGGFITLSRRLLDGELFNDLDVKRAANVCIISESLARTFFPGQTQTGRPMRINNVAFRVVGVVDDVPSETTTDQQSDLHIYIPFTSLLRRIDATAQMGVIVQADDIEHVTVVQEAIDDLMAQRRSNRKGEFTTNNAFDALRMYADGSLTVARLLATIGAIALMVGGIGIMNIMLAGVTERTREIGIRIALGTRGRDVRTQFLMEAIALSLLGGTVGIAVGSATSLVLTRLNGWPTEVTLSSILVALLCSAGVGVLFGWYPARRASLLSPVEALRSE